MINVRKGKNVEFSIQLTVKAKYLTTYKMIVFIVTIKFTDIKILLLIHLL